MSGTPVITPSSFIVGASQSVSMTADQPVQWAGATAVDSQHATFTAPASINAPYLGRVLGVSLATTNAQVNTRGQGSGLGSYQVTIVGGKGDFSSTQNLATLWINGQGYEIAKIISPTALNLFYGPTSDLGTMTVPPGAATWDPLVGSAVVQFEPVSVAVRIGRNLSEDGCVVPAGDTLQLLSDVEFANGNTSVTWSCSGPGSVDFSGLYTAAAAPGNSNDNDIITATSQADPSRSGSVSVQLLNATARVVDIHPATYVPPSGWKLDGGPGMALNGPSLVRRFIVPA